MKPLFCLVVVLGFLVSLSACEPSPDSIQTAIAQTQTAEPVVVVTAIDVSSGEETANVVGVVDGDTIDVALGGDITRVRYIGVNTPERGEVCYQEAKQANADLVENQTVVLRKDTSETDRYSRLLRFVYVGEVFVNAELVHSGFAEAVEYKPDVSFAEYFEKLEAEARAANLACYATGIFGSVNEQDPLATQPPQGYDTNGDGKVTCSDFTSQAQAQEALNNGYDGLDGNGDSEACESLP